MIVVATYMSTAKSGAAVNLSPSTNSSTAAQSLPRTQDP